MMKIIILAISIVFLCNTSGIAQKTISESDYNHLVDYANCMYVKTFIENEKFPEEYINNSYDSKIKPALEKVTLEDLSGIVRYDALKELLSKNELALALAKKINNKKSDFYKYNDDQTLINSLGATKWKRVDLKQTASTIQKNIFKKFGIIEDNEKNGEQKTQKIDFKDTTSLNSKQIATLQIRLSQVQKQYYESKELLDNFRLIGIGTFGFLIFIIGFVFFYINQRLKTNKRNKNKGNDSLKKEIEQPQIEFKDFKKLYNIDEITSKINEIDILKISIKDLQNRVHVLEHQKELPKQPEQKPLKEETDTTSTSDKIFLKEREGMLLFKESVKENAYYELFNINGNKALYKFCGNEGRSMANYDAVLKDVFDDEKSYSSKAKQINNTKDGVVELQADGKWKIKTPAKIKFI